MTRGSVAASARRRKEAHPEQYCTARNCLWRIVTERGPSPCMKHPVPEPFDTAENEAAITRLHASLSAAFPPRSPS